MVRSTASITFIESIFILRTVYHEIREIKLEYVMRRLLQALELMIDEPATGIFLF